jgi:Fe2+ or Zn2+ uptake regulation protein
VDRAVSQDRLELFLRRSAEQGMPVTAQRRVVLETVLEMDNHPTADQVHAAVADRMPELNRTTVYRSLETLVKLGLLTRLCHPGRVVRFDPRTGMHHHLICLHCDTVVDIDDDTLDRIEVPDTSSRGFELQDFRVQLRGICRQCREKENPS